MLNFALGPMAMVGAFTYYETTQDGWPIIVALMAGVLLSAATGALSYILVMRNLLNATPLARMGAILGMTVRTRRRPAPTRTPEQSIDAENTSGRAYAKGNLAISVS